MQGKLERKRAEIQAKRPLRRRYADCDRVCGHLPPVCAADHDQEAQPLEAAVRRERFAGNRRAGPFCLPALFRAADRVNRAIRDSGGTDFTPFYRAGRYVLEHGDTEPRRFLKYYWPLLDVAWAGLAWLPVPVACTLYYLFNCGTWMGLLAATSRWPLRHVDGAAPPTGRFGCRTAGHAACVGPSLFGRSHILMVWLMVAGIGRVP